MKISALNEGVSLIANIGVIGSIVFLGLEMQQNTSMMQSQTRNSIVENQLSFYERAIDNIEFSRIAMEFRADSTAYPIGTAEAFQYRLFVISQLRIWENEFYQYQAGLFEASVFQSRVNTWREQIVNDSLFETWELRRDQFAPDFVEYLDNIIAEELAV